MIKNLHDAINRLREDMERVEIWAEALECFTNPVPEYDPASGNLSRYVLPQSSAGTSTSRALPAEDRMANKSPKGALKPDPFPR